MNPAIQITTTNFETSDISLAAYLALHFTVKDLDFTDPRRVKFVFEKSPEIEQKVDMFWRKDTFVEPQEYFISLKVLKGRLYNAKPLANDQPYR